MDLTQIAQAIQQLTQGETIAIAVAESDGKIMHYAAAIGKHLTDSRNVLAE